MSLRFTFPFAWDARLSYCGKVIVSQTARSVSPWPDSTPPALASAVLLFLKRLFIMLYATFSVKAFYGVARKGGRVSH